MVKILKLRWKKTEINKLKNLVLEGKPISFIAKKLNRSYSSVAHKLNRINIKHPYLSPSFQPIISSEFAYLLGAWFGDRTSPKKLGIFVKDKDFAVYFKNCLIKILKRNIKMHKYNGRYFVQRIDSNFADWINKNTLKDIETFIITGGPNSISNFLSGFFDAEGTCVDRYTQASQKTKEILEVCKNLLQKLDISSYLSKQKDREDYIYVLRIEKLSSLIRFYNNIGFKIKRKQEKLQQIIKIKIDLQKKYFEKYHSFKRLQETKNVSYIAKELNLSKATIYNWINGKPPILIRDNISMGDII